MNKSRGRITACLFALLALAAAPLTAEGPEDAAQAAAESWLRLVDAGNYAGSWSQSGKALKAAFRQNEWAEAAEGVRAPLGGLVSRKVKSREYTERAPATRTIGGRVYTFGEGKFVVVQYESTFANKGQAAEGVVVAAESDGAWRVAGYSVR